MLEIREEHLSKFKWIKKRFFQKTCVPKKDNWKSRTNNGIWLELVKQVIVVGRSEPSEKLERDVKLKKSLL